MKVKNFYICLIFSLLTHIVLFSILFLRVKDASIYWALEGKEGKGSSLLIQFRQGLESIVHGEKQNKIIPSASKNALKFLSPEKQIPIPAIPADLSPASAQNTNTSPSGEGEGGGAIGSSGKGEGGGQASSILAEIRKKIERSKKYPPLARSRQIEGVSQVYFTLGNQGEVQKLSLLHSSGSEILDEEALATVKRAAPYPLYPQPIQVSIRFSLE